MSKQNKFEQLITYIINEDEENAKALFHQIVVEKSRDIYEGLVDEDQFPIQKGRTVQRGLGSESLTDEISDHQDVVDGDEEGMHEAEDEPGDDEFEVPAEDEFGGDEDEFGGDEDEFAAPEGEGEGELEDRVMDLEDAIDELKAEFDQLMAGEEHEEEEFPGIHGEGEPDTEMAADLGGDDGEEEIKEEESASIYEAEKADKKDKKDGKKPAFLEKAEKKAEEKEGKDVKEARKSPADLMREYVEKVTIPSNKSESGDLVGTGAESGGKPTVNTKSTQISGKNDMGGTTANIARGGNETAPDGTSPYKQPKNEYSKGEGDLPGAGKFENVPGARAGQAFKKAAKPASKEGSPAGAKNTMGSNVNAKSPDQATGGKPGFTQAKKG